MKKDRCPCGGIILADTEDWAVPLCYSCFVKFCEDARELQTENIRLKQQVIAWQEQAVRLAFCLKDNCRCNETHTLRSTTSGKCILCHLVDEFEAFKASSEGEK